MRVEKQDANTLHVARELAASVGRPAAEIGFAGMKFLNAALFATALGATAFLFLLAAILIQFVPETRGRELE